MPIHPPREPGPSLSRQARAAVHQIVFGHDDPSYCHCEQPMTDAEYGLDTAEPWCWTCHRALPPPHCECEKPRLDGGACLGCGLLPPPPSLLGRIRAFVA